MPDKALGLNHQTIGELEGGGMAYAIDKALGELMIDCQRRPGLSKPRKLTLTVTITPNANTLDDGGQGLKGVEVKADVKTAFPSRASSGEYLNVTQSADVNGEPQVEATFAVTPLLRAGSN
ncbi:hypothetical protein IHN63_02190 [Deinococcus sp. 6YEL10]|uniref:hypothetical protein n=1 Tax=Deinococcus sp. 6YEL10 TaxID=2745870 RepID=UPI001E2E6026|nr:hypothetical protein [Deinococcus sp. 6YEL10]MCD0160110.1 hypothetical protein [Deinococcus sp. 6YEL10]